MIDQYQLGMFTIGGWVNQKQGRHFQEVKPQHDQAAMVYLYRPDINWNRQEIVASSLFLNSERIPSLLNNHYYLGGVTGRELPLIIESPPFGW